MHDETVVLGLQQLDGKRFELVLDGVEALQADDFRAGNLSNIIYSLTVMTNAKVDCGRLKERRLFPAPHSTAAPTYHELYTERLDRVCARIESGEAAMVVLEASLGCDLAAICRGVRLTTIEG